MTATHQPQTTRNGEPGAWQAFHIFYAANPQPLLLQCVRPLVDSLTADRLLAGYFFINYWLEGPHVRLRLRPVDEAAADEVRERTERAVEGFLRARPALYEVGPGFLNELYNTLFDLEIPEDDRPRFLGADGRMQLRPNNTCHREVYEPEFDKYGGPAGIELAEWHFRHSSDLVIEALRTKNLHLRTVLLGTSSQLMMVMAATFVDGPDALAEYLDRYYTFWHEAFPDTGFIGTQEYDRTYDRMADQLRQRFTVIRTCIADGATAHLPSFLRGWAAHCAELRERATALALRGELVFSPRDGAPGGTITDPRAALPRLLSPYMHMTNNRLHVTIRDEAYLAHILGRSLRETLEETSALGGSDG